MTGPDDTGAGGPGEPVGSLADEAAKLMGALGEWARDQGPGLGGGMAAAAAQASETVRQVNEHVATGAPECTYCPICRTVHVIRETSPEVREQLMVAASALLQAGTGILASLRAGQAGQAPPGRRRDQPGVERIDLDEPDGDAGSTDDWTTQDRET